MSKKMLLVLMLSCLSASLLPAQFISEVRRPGPRHWPRPHRTVPVTVVSHSVQVAVVDGVALVTVRESFRNQNLFGVEGSYFFPLPEDAAIQGFAMQMGSKLVQGEILEKSKAASIYQAIVRRRRDPALLEYVGRRLFRARLFPIPPGGVTRIELRYSQTLRRSGNTVEFRYPFRTRGITHAPVARASFAMTIVSKEPMRAVYSPSHQMEVLKDGDHKAKLSFETRGAAGERDIVVIYGLSKRPVGATLFTHGEQDEGTFLLLLAPSEEKRGRLVEKDVVFVIDTSGSMAGPKLEQTKKALRFCVNSLGPQDRFEIISFATEPRPLFGQLSAPNAAALQKARGFIAGIEARGGTNINEALLRALALSRDRTRPFLVIFMTDGEPTVGVTIPKNILAQVKKANKALTRLFVFGVGDDVNAQLLDELAEENHGARDYVGNQESIELKISSFFQKVASPVLSDLHIKVQGVEVLDLYPRKLPDLFLGSQLLVAGRFKGSGKATLELTGQVNGQQQQDQFPLTFSHGSAKTAFVPRLWAVRKVGYLMDQIRLHGQNQELKQEVVRLGKKYGIVTPYTSYLVVEDAVASVRRQSGGGFYRGQPPRAPRERSRNKRGFQTHDLGQAPGQRVQVDGFLKTQGEAAKKAAKAARRGRLEGLASSGLASKEKAEDDDRKVDRPGFEKDLSEARKKALDKLGKVLVANSVRRSLELKGLKQAVRGDTAGAELLVRRVGNKTFYRRLGYYIEASLLGQDTRSIKQKLVRIIAFSDEYMKLARNKALARILALGDHLLFQDGQRIIQVLPPSPPPAGKK